MFRYALRTQIAMKDLTESTYFVSKRIKVRSNHRIDPHSSSYISI